MAISTWTSTTRWKTSASCLASCSPKRWAIARASTARATSSCPWTRPSPWSPSISADAPPWSTRRRLGKTYLPRYADNGNPWIDVGDVFSLAGLAARGYRGRTADQLVEDVPTDEKLAELLREGARGLGIAVAPL